MDIAGVSAGTCSPAWTATPHSTNWVPWKANGRSPAMMVRGIFWPVAPTVSEIPLAGCRHSCSAVCSAHLVPFARELAQRLDQCDQIAADAARVANLAVAPGIRSGDVEAVLVNVQSSRLR
ncbi:MAG TPA: hypothetical protein DHV85_01265 [Candidatus Accumulibacter sp.]|jgi:hypothetical protein|nr:hypothetical protein [Accumulibacter sp.]